MVPIPNKFYVTFVGAQTSRKLQERNVVHQFLIVHTQDRYVATIFISYWLSGGQILFW